jgi:uncharacterized protein (DUF3084 family)
MADSELDKLKKENEELKQKLSPLSANELTRLSELHSLVASTSSGDSKFKEYVTEFKKLNARKTGNVVLTMATVTN